MSKIISDEAIKRRKYWVEEIRKLSGHFGNDTEKLEKELETKKNGISSLIDYLRLCGNIPESYGHDTSEEKLYSKYTDCLLSLAYTALGLKSLVLKERADAADAKAFRLSRTAKNQKDFKVQAMHWWKRGKPHAMVVCPIYQLSTSSSQIYQQATTQNVCVFTYSHLALLLSYSEVEGQAKAQQLGFNLHDTMIFRKTNPIPQIYRKRYNNEFEFMFVFSKGTVKTHNPLMIDCLHAGLELNGTTYKNFSKNEQTREKMAKPVKDKKIKGNIIKSWTNQGDIVFDPMSGSGTTARVACETGR